VKCTDRLDTEAALSEGSGLQHDVVVGHELLDAYQIGKGIGGQAMVLVLGVQQREDRGGDDEDQDTLPGGGAGGYAGGGWEPDVRDHQPADRRGREAEGDSVDVQGTRLTKKN